MDEQFSWIGTLIAFAVIFSGVMVVVVAELLTR